VGGYASTSPTDAAVPSTGFVARLTPNGAIDPGFGDRGRVVLTGVGGFPPSTLPTDRFTFDGNPRVRLKVLLTTDGRVLALGSTLVRLSRDGSVDRAFRSSGTAALPAGFTPAGLALDPAGRTLLIGTRELPGRTAGAVVRLGPDGQLDAGFGAADGNAGMVTLPVVSSERGRPATTVSYRGVALAADGSIVVAGIGDDTDGDGDLVDLFARLTPDGRLDQQFGLAGQAVVPPMSSFEPSTLTIDSRGRALVAGSGCGDGVAFVCFPAVQSLTATGQAERPLDPRIRDRQSDKVGTLTVLPDGDRLISEELNGGPSLALARLGRQWIDLGADDSGSDTLFGGLAVGRLPAGSHTGGIAVLQPDGKIIVAGSAPSAGGQTGLLVGRLFGLSPRPPASVSIRRDSARASALGVSVLVDCGAYVACRDRACCACGGAVTPGVAGCSAAARFRSLRAGARGSRSS